eukprot:203371-Rhodomonas_salina.1
MKEYAAEKAYNVFAAEDFCTAEGKTFKWFGAFRTHTQFLTAILESEQQCQCFYEMVREGRPCK